MFNRAAIYPGTMARPRWAQGPLRAGEFTSMKLLTLTPLLVTPLLVPLLVNLPIDNGASSRAANL